MWINLDDKQMTGVESALASSISRYREALDTLMNGNQALNASAISDITKAKDELQAILDRFGKARAEFDPADPYRAYLQTQADDEMEVDDDAVVSPGSDPGAFVQAWIWVRNDEAGVQDEDDEDACRDCGAHYEDGGDGYNGRCPDCADKAEEEGRADD
ncbi:hypothetical protein B7L88_gp149 [Rhizobium phage RHEph10]|uniref:hypothetical protein n=1 Tax=Rhizobium phage RHEph10 TaxID=1220717 RepID=UPI0002AB32FF|nr:hypothetical protein B7L88_gp149 [Rhizobium phage RHEph10]AGC36139.1 hypothetical protein RHEph10_gp096 [Rhizobium phage RHEph10]